MNDELYHEGRLGQRWGVRNGPPYPLDRDQVAGSQYDTVSPSGKKVSKLEKAKNAAKTAKKITKKAGATLVGETILNYHDARYSRNKFLAKQAARAYKKAEEKGNQQKAEHNKQLVKEYEEVCKKHQAAINKAIKELRDSGNTIRSRNIIRASDYGSRIVTALISTGVPIFAVPFTAMGSTMLFTDWRSMNMTKQYYVNR